MNFSRLLLLVVASLLMGGFLDSCAHPKTLGRLRGYNQDYKGAWENPFRGDPNLAGVNVIQYGECPYENWTFDGKHPCNIWYFFWNGRVRQIQYLPDGKVWDDFYWPQRLKPGDPFWKGVDFAFGSDPQFKKHRDPRLPAAKQKADSHKQ